MQGNLKNIVERFPWTIAFAFFAVSVLINSQGATLVAMLPGLTSVITSTIVGSILVRIFY
ncbi:MAG: hypothetical protein IJL70_03125 [Treponema sp.]|nr:hypothetical protein [Treponema sp.]